jgi:hypothetical protein
MDKLLPGDLAAQERYGLLVGALGHEPEGGFHRAVLARLVSWTDRPDIAALAAMIRDSKADGAQALDILAEIVPLVRRSKEVSDQGAVVIAVPQELAHRITAAAAGRA